MTNAIFFTDRNSLMASKVSTSSRGIGLVVVLPGTHKKAEDVFASVEAPFEELQDGGLPATPWRVDADRDRVHVSAGNDRLHNIDDIFEAEQVNLARVVSRSGIAARATPASLTGSP